MGIFYDPPDWTQVDPAAVDTIQDALAGAGNDLGRAALAYGRAGDAVTARALRSVEHDMTRLYFLIQHLATRGTPDGVTKSSEAITDPMLLLYAIEDAGVQATRISQQMQLLEDAYWNQGGALIITNE
jgi:hypothetical protein